MDNKDTFKTPTGQINMTLFKGDYDIKTGKITGEILQESEDHNIIVNMASVLMASRMCPKGLTETSDTVVAIPWVQTDGYTITNANGEQQYVSNTNSGSSDGIGVVSASTIGTASATSNYSATQASYPFGYGFQCLAIGNGDYGINTGWSDTEKATYLFNPETNNQPADQKLKTGLIHEIFRKQITSWSFLDTEGNVSNTETNILKLTTLFTADEAPGQYIVEMGLFGGDANVVDYNSITNAVHIDEYCKEGNANGNRKGHMFNYKIFKSWNKIEGSSLLVNWIITF
jgi:hypothetical protein